MIKQNHKPFRNNQIPFAKCKYQHLGVHDNTGKDIAVPKQCIHKNSYCFWLV